MYLPIGVALYCACVVLWRLSRRKPRQPWHAAADGFRAEPRPGHRVVRGALLFLGVLLLLGTAVSAWGTDSGEGSGGVSGGGETSLLGFVCFVLVRELIRSSAGPVVVNSAGVSVGGRLYPWRDVQQAYLVGNSVELRVTPRWIPWFGDRRVHLHDRAYLVPAAEIHWLIQHYLLFPAERGRMDRLPTRAYELPA
jgi:hypothetical protein